MIYFQYFALFAVLTTGTQRNRLASNAEFDRRAVHLTEEGRRNLALGRYTSRPKSHEGIQCHDMTWWDDGAGWDCKEWESRNLCDGDYSTSYQAYGFIVDQAAVAAEFANPVAKMQFTTGMIPMDLPTIVIGMLEMLVLVRTMGMLLKTEGTPQRQLAVHVVVVILVFGMLFVQADEHLKMIQALTLH